MNIDITKVSNSRIILLHVDTAQITHNCLFKYLLQENTTPVKGD